MKTITIKAEDIPNLIIQAGEDEYRLTKVEKEAPGFWEGQLVEVWDKQHSFPPQHRFFSHIEGNRYACHLDSAREGDTRTWGSCRPLQDPLILQFKAHVPGDPMPCDADLRVRTISANGSIGTGEAKYCYWGTGEGRTTVGWMPAAGWGGGE